MPDKITRSALKSPLLLSLSLFFLLFYENKQNLRGNIFPKQVKLKKIGQCEKEFCKKSFQYLHPKRKENLTLFTSMAILDENLNY